MTVDFVNYYYEQKDLLEKSEQQHDTLEQKVASLKKSQAMFEEAGLHAKSGEVLCVIEKMEDEMRVLRAESIRLRVEVPSMQSIIDRLESDSNLKVVAA